MGSKLVYVLEHEYSDTNRCFLNLKGKDKSIGYLFSDIAQSKDLDYMVFLASVDILQIEEIIGAACYYDRMEYTQRTCEFSGFIDGCYDSPASIKLKESCKSFEDFLPYGSLDTINAYDSYQSGEYTGNQAANEESKFRTSVLLICKKSELSKVFKNSTSWLVDFTKKQFDSLQLEDTQESANQVLKCIKCLDPNILSIPQDLEIKIKQKMPNQMEYIKHQKNIQFDSKEFIQNLKIVLETNIYTKKEIESKVLLFKSNKANDYFTVLNEFLLPLSLEYPNIITTDLIIKFNELFKDMLRNVLF
ncbi:hypothetical protein DICPUDRAFT_83536 [Dictyostelium purpureum]|uniref:Uncharacterized protein n=1 Tax=Dictyostelium purpureum TaxID=5786 RepID=F0ZZT8_DICPU|nr:uncharacterized protein DICPUDRAFT_83536 [Dictyostelium purpureum]EGC30536.1 hypothetical protein DICPUDRAFT_83536 [Dictyostelium purpureum]|eukprot:XP_003292931.1 hypothetical protein DICPUDRAFT_83536 [Dictyostelium purpureum]